MSRDREKEQVRRELGLLLREKREQLGYSRTEFANMVKVDKSTIERMELGKTFPSVPTLFQIYHFAGLSIDELFNKLRDSVDYLDTID
ncbi:helix-turn-helix transcriptional regulator [Bacillus sp. FJAT-45066]|uniref:helix-turn-helix transcriptional regulator n=1 Tax=Bacillus sp. FJAT-45066 TaxID=2011010 RepID=UPI00159678D0|nr:helix-turn-helix transcriptional regulator [Bacillus sp. FJAT-45066]